MTVATTFSTERRMRLPRLTAASAIATILLIVSLGVAFLGPLFRPHNPNDLIASPMLRPSHKYPLGTDDLGRDLFSRVLSGGSNVVMVALLVTVVAFTIGAVLGMAAGYVQGRFDLVVTRSVDVLIALPALLFAIVFISGLGSSLHVLVLVISVFFVPRIVRIVRGATAPVVANDYVNASRLRGLGTGAILWRDVIPNIAGILVVEFAARLGSVLMFVATLNFLGLGAQPPASNWGLMVSETLPLLRSNPAALMAPTALIAALTVGVSLFADQFAARLAMNQLAGRNA
ncbi:ABC transporter permease [Streptomyces sp. NPDC017964]|uniref:ABC transporter permease n=1 Tax=Streptomyces sp. NPDC017964 TaxID=3365022 RepID=UPI003797F3E7